MTCSFPVGIDSRGGVGPHHPYATANTAAAIRMSFPNRHMARPSAVAMPTDYRAPRRPSPGRRGEGLARGGGPAPAGDAPQGQRQPGAEDGRAAPDQGREPRRVVPDEETVGAADGEEAVAEVVAIAI